MGQDAVAYTLQVTGFQIHLKYDEVPIPSWGDGVVMEFAMEMGLDKEKTCLSISRVRGKLGLIFLSDVTTTNEKHL